MVFGNLFHLIELARALEATAAFRLDVFVEILLAVVVEQFFARFYFFLGVNDTAMDFASAFGTHEWLM